MNTDWRLDQNSILQERREREDSEYRQRYQLDKWAEWAAPLSKLAFDTIANNQHEIVVRPKNIPDDVKTAWDAIYSSIVTHDHLNQSEAIYRILSSEIFIMLARHVSDKSQLWLKAMEMASLFPNGWNIIVDNMDTMQIVNQKDELFKFPSIEAQYDWIDNHYSVNEDNLWDQLLETMQQTSTDSWSYLDRIHRLSQHISPCTHIHFKSQLVQRLGAPTWSRWIANIPIIPIAENFIFELKSIDYAFEILSSILTSMQEKEKAETLCLMIIRKVLDISVSIWINLEHGADIAWNLPGDDPGRLTKYSDAFRHWKESELRERGAALATMLEHGGEMGLNIIIILLQHLYSRPRNNTEREVDSVTNNVIRAALIDSLHKLDFELEKILLRILSDIPTDASLLSSSQLVLSDKNLKNISQTIFAHIWSSYSKWIVADRLYYDNLHRGDDMQLIWCMAGIFSNMEKYVSLLSDFLFRIEVQADGWRHDYMRYWESVNRICHIVSTAAMSSEWLIQKGDTANAIVVFDYIWEYFHRWIRSLNMINVDNYVSTTLLHLWARLFLVHKDNAVKIVLDGIDSIDNMEWILLACNNLRLNLPKPLVLDISIQKSIHARFEEWIPVIRLRRHIDAKQVENLFRQELELTPNIERKNTPI